MEVWIGRECQCPAPPPNQEPPPLRSGKRAAPVAVKFTMRWHCETPSGRAVIALDQHRWQAIRACVGRDLRHDPSTSGTLVTPALEGSGLGPKRLYSGSVSHPVPKSHRGWSPESAPALKPEIAFVDAVHVTNRSFKQSQVFCTLPRSMRKPMRFGAESLPPA